MGGFLPAVKQIANVAALPGIVGVRSMFSRQSLSELMELNCKICHIFMFPNEVMHREVFIFKLQQISTINYS